MNSDAIWTEFDSSRVSCRVSVVQDMTEFGVSVQLCSGPVFVGPSPAITTMTWFVKFQLLNQLRI